MNNEISRLVGARLEALRKEHGVTLASAAVMAGVCVRTYRKFERGEGIICVDHVLPLLRYYKMTMDQLLEGLLP